MAKKDRLDDEEVDTQADQTEENAMAKKDDESDAEASTEGLVKMHKDGMSLHVHPTTIRAHKEAGWELV